MTTGPYRTVRHPIYSGIILALAGTAIAVSLYWLIAVALAGGYFSYSATVEERYMAGVFPDAYPRYKQATKMLIPSSSEHHGLRGPAEMARPGGGGAARRATGRPGS